MSPRPALWPLWVAAGAGVWSWRACHATPAENAAPPASVTAAPLGAAAGGSTAQPAFPCPPEQLPDDGVCIPVPPPAEPAAEAETRLELLPGRSSDYGRYVTPIAAYPAAAPAQGLGAFIAAPRGVPVTTISLEAQTGATRRWVSAGPAPRLVTLHRVDRAGSLRTYVIAYEGLSFDAAPGLSDVDVGTPLGRVAAAANGAANGAVGGAGGRLARPSSGLLLAVRQVRRGVNAEELDPERLLRDDTSLDCDARNVLPLKPAP